MLKTLLKVQFAALKASLFRSRRKQSKGGTGCTISGSSSVLMIKYATLSAVTG